jgi:tetratricopeptide (TPR) repeat protein
MEPEFKPLEPPARFHVNAAAGWLGLGDVVSARDELDQIAPDLQTHPIVLMAKCQIYMAAKEWESLIQTAASLIRDFPALHEAWVNRSYALHELKRTHEAFDALLPAAAMFPKIWVVPYNLACYCAQTGRLREALDWVNQAIDLAGGKDVRAQALEDPDLQPIWKEITD